MGLFDKFTDSVFIKDDNTLERRLSKLNNIRNRVQEKEQIAREIKLLSYGIKGEKNIEFELKNANIGLYILHDVNIEYDDLKAQIDYIIISPAYIYPVECKNLIGNVTVDSKGEFRREYVLNDKKIKEAIYSPYTQALRHKDILKKIWISKHNKLERLLFEKNFDSTYRPLIVLANSKGILNIRYAPKDIRNCTIRVDQLVNYIKTDINRTSKDSLRSQKSMLEVANSLLSKCVDVKNDPALKYTFIDIKDKLKEYRLAKAKKHNIPAYYIFTDEELDKMLTQNIETFDQLVASKILSDVKLKFHGREIIDIINNK